ncbi:uncharacterized protein RJT20DRAFT_30143 [Scheffersomyces xylosifermentans]|uniref:uncharacterized protein n=1 Tax=Scheffersomyces xylosifermentans TaxID=1304137 RepID=UPI00315D2594
MGAGLSLLAPSAPTVAISSYVDVLEDYQYIELINNSRFLKTVKAIDKKSGMYVILKILIKPAGTTSNDTLALERVIESLGRQSFLIASFPNIIPFHKIIETDRAGYLIRKMAKTNLYDRISLRPFLEPIEKLFVVFQMLKVVSKLHSLGVHHGDLKLENFLVTPWNWVMLSDFAEFLKPRKIPEDNPNQYSFYFDNSARRICYLAPERFYNSKENSNAQSVEEDSHRSGVDKLTDEMDLFSLGCVIAEFFSDGEPTFTLSQLFKYMKNEYVPDFSSIHNNSIKDLVAKLITIRPEDRVPADELIETFRGKCFPDVFYDFLYDFMSDLYGSGSFTIPQGDDNVSISDLKIEKIYNNFDKIANALHFDYNNPNQSAGVREKNGFVPLKLNLPGIPKNYVIKPNNYPKEDEGSTAAIILSVVFSLSKSLKRVSSKIKACELILALSERVNDECKLDRSLPILCSFLDEFVESSSAAILRSLDIHKKPLDLETFKNSNISSKVACTALTSITTLILSCSYIAPINVLLFPKYLLPKLFDIYQLNIPEEESNIIKVTLAGCLPYLANSSKKLWMMSKSFKVEDNYNRNMPVSLSGNINGNASTNTLSISKDELDNHFEELTHRLLTDSSSSVRISLVNSILPLCHFFGIEKTNDIILPHLISYLNDSNIGLRLAFLSSILQIAPFVGVLSFEQYILPLLVQTLGDSEQLVILKVLEIFNEFVQTRLINPRTEFNALDIYKELLSNSINLLLHPNEWIRQSVLCLIVSISDNLTDADRYCFLYPLIKGFLTYDLSIISWGTLYPCLTKPLSRQVYKQAITWCLEATSESLFWQRGFSAANPSTRIDSQIVSVSKNMATSVYLSKAHPHSNFSNGAADLSLSPEDKRSLMKLKAVGLADKDTWKIFVMKDHILRVAKSANSIYNPSSNYKVSADSDVDSKRGDSTKFENEEDNFKKVSDHLEIRPRNIFFDICYKSEPLLSGSRTSEANIEASTKPGDSISLQGFDARRASASLVLPNLARVKASVQTVEANVFGELEMSHDAGNLDSLYHQHHHHVHSTRDSNSTHRMFVVNNMKTVTVNITHDYNGHNPFILNYLNGLSFEPSLSEFPEFGNIVRSSKPSLGVMNSAKQWSPKGILVSRINPENNNGNIDGITCLVTGPTSEFFVSGSEMGLLKIWDNYKMEKITTVNTASLTLDLESAITTIRFIADRFVMAVATVDGAIRIFRIDVNRGKNKRITKYTKLSLIRKYDLSDNNDSLNGAYLLECEFILSEKQSLLIGITPSGFIIALDIIKMEKVFVLQNPLIHGAPQSFIVDHNGDWLLTRTARGILCLWDLRFKILVSVKKIQLQIGDERPHTTAESTGRLVLLPKDFKLPTANGSSYDDAEPPSTTKGKEDAKSYFMMIGCSKEGDISIWEIPSFKCKHILSSHVDNPYIKNYSLVEVPKSKEVDIDSLVSDINFEVNGLEGDAVVSNHSMTSISHFSFNNDNYLISSTWDRRIIAWNLDNVKASVSVNSDHETRFVKNTFSKQAITLINETQVKNSQKTAKENVRSLKEIAQAQPNSLARHQDKITAIDVITKPFEMIVSADRNGFINLYK